VTYGTDWQPEAIVIVDLDGDGHKDVVAATTGVTVMLNQCR
jgi:hypothetical protein